MTTGNIITLQIKSLGEDGDGIAQHGRTTVYVSNALPGETVTAIITDTAKTHAHARLLKVKKPSEYRVKPLCRNVRECGGCQVQEMDYRQQLSLKRNIIINNLDSAHVATETPVAAAIGCKRTTKFRNKAIYPISKNADGQIVAGFFARRSHQIIPSYECPIGADENMAVTRIVIDHLKRYGIEPYDETQCTGIVRYVMIRKAFSTGELMVSIVINGNTLPHHNDLTARLLAVVKNIKDISIVINNDNTNRIRGTEVATLHGDGYITDTIGDLKFMVSPLSFYQVNTPQTAVLYTKAIDFAQLTGGETVFDLYCGIGTISLFLARHAKKVYGVETIPQAIDDARRNAESNNIKNVDFIVGKAEEVIPELVEKQGIRADVVVVDPPRKGCDKSLIDTIIKMLPQRIVYVSCESMSLARDLKILTDNGFRVKKVQPVDMFPHTVHVETVALIEHSPSLSD